MIHFLFQYLEIVARHDPRRAGVCGLGEVNRNPRAVTAVHDRIRNDRAGSANTAERVDVDVQARNKPVDFVTQRLRVGLIPVVVSHIVHLLLRLKRFLA